MLGLDVYEPTGGSVVITVGVGGLWDWSFCWLLLRRRGWRIDLRRARRYRGYTHFVPPGTYPFIIGRWVKKSRVLKEGEEFDDVL
jgi:hypothetical protein